MQIAENHDTEATKVLQNEIRHQHLLKLHLEYPADKYLPQLQKLLHEDLSELFLYFPEFLVQNYHK